MHIDHKKKNIHTSTEQGNILIIVMVLFVALSLSIAMGLVVPVITANRIATNNLESKRSYAIAESGVEDVLYRLRNSMQVSTSENLVLGTQSVTTTLTDISGDNKEIVAMGDANNRNRTVSAVLEQGEGVSFVYGIQSGQGGLTMGNNAGIIGSVYANGPITGGYISGSATSANSAALYADQQNGTGVPPNNIVFGNANSTQDIAQSFTVSATQPLNKVQLYIKKTPSTPANLTIRITADTNGSPSSSSIATGTLSTSLVSTNYGWVDISLSSTPQLDAGTTYWLVIDGATNSTKYYTIGGDSLYANGLAKTGKYNISWNDIDPSGLDIYFKVYLGGFQGLISGTRIGYDTVGDAYANTVKNSLVAGTNYCKTGTGNNKTCNTSRADPVAIDMPISQQNIEDWKLGAVEGGTYTGNYSINDTTVSLGPKKITGDLTIGNNATLNMTGTLWVQGNVNLSNNSSIRLVSSYGSTGGVIIVDGTVTLANNALFWGSGTSGSYVMVLSTSSSDSAITVGNNAGAVVLYAANGTVNVSNNAGAREITGYKINLSNNAVVVYDSGLANANFTNGPSGSWTVQSWRETQ